MSIAPRRVRSSFTRACLCVCLLAFAACDGPTRPTASLDTDVVLQPDQVATIDDAGLRVKFIGVSGDSRCPGDAICITGGDATVVIDVGEPRGGVVRYDLHTATPDVPVVHRGFRVWLRELAPYPFSSRPIDPLDYRATLRISSVG